MFSRKSGPDIQTALAGTRMSLGEHIDELRRCLIRSLLGLALALAVCLWFGNSIIGFLAMPLMIALKAAGQTMTLNVTSLTESFMVYIKVSLYSSLVLAAPWIFYNLWSFIASGLYQRERRVVMSIVPLSTFLFVLGWFFFIFVIAPLSCYFLASFSTKVSSPDLTHPSKLQVWLLELMGYDGDKPPAAGEKSPPPAGTTTPPAQPPQTPLAPGQTNPPPAQAITSGESLIHNLFTLNEYISFVIALGLAFGLSFQTPLVVFTLGRVGIVKLETFRKSRKYAILGIFIAAAILTPGPDIASQVALGIPMVLLYEMGIAMLKIWPRKARL